METVSEIRPRYAETDQMGIVHHGSFVVWLEVGRTDFIRALGLPYRELEAMGYRLVVNGVSLTYRSPALYDDPIQVRTRLTEVTGRKVVFGYRVEREGQLLAEGESVHLVAGTDNRARVLPAEIRELLGRGLTPPR